MGNTLRNLTVKVGADLTGMQKGLKQASKEWKAAGKELTNTGKTMTMGLTVPIMGAAVAAVKFASDMEESTNKVNVAFGDSANEVKDWSATTLKSIGLAKGSALDMASTFGDMGTAMGQSTGDAASMSTTLVNLAADMASFKNISIEQASTALRGIYTGEGEALKSLGVIMQDSTLIAYAQAEGYEKSYKEMTQAEKVALRYKYVMNATKNAQGDFARTSEGVANQTRLVQESMKEAAASIGESLLPYVAKALKGVNELVGSFTSLSDEQKNTIITVGLVVASIGPALTIMGKLSTGVGGVMTSLSKATKVLSGGGSFTAALSTLIGPAGIAVLAIAAVAGVALAVAAVTKESREATKAVQTYADSLAAAKTAYDDQVQGIDNSAEANKKLAQKLFALQSIENKTNGEKSQMVDLVKQLNTQMPELNLQIDEQTGKLNQSSYAVYGYIDAMKERLKYEAQQERLLQLYKDQASNADQMTAAQQRLTKAKAVYDGMIIKYGYWGAKAWYEVQQAEKAIDILNGTISETDTSTTAAEKALDNYYDTVSGGTKIIQEEYKFVTAAGIDFTNSQKEQAEEQVAVEEKTTEEIAELLAQQLEDRKESNKAITDAAKNYTDQMGALDDKGIEKTKLTAKEIKENRQQQLKDFQQWRADITQLASRVPDDVMTELRALGPEMQPVIAELNAMTDTQLSSWVEVWRAPAAAAREAAVQELAKLPASAYNIGANVGTSLAAGLDSNLSAVQAAAKRFTNASKILSPDWQLVFGPGSLPQYASGTDYVPRTGPAIIHEGEAVLTKEENAGRGGAGIDAAGIKQAIRDSMAGMAIIVDGQQFGEVGLDHMTRAASRRQVAWPVKSR